MRAAKAELQVKNQGVGRQAMQPLENARHIVGAAAAATPDDDMLVRLEVHEPEGTGIGSG